MVIIISSNNPGGSEVKAFTSNAGDPGSIPGLGRYPGEGNGYPLQYSGLENATDCYSMAQKESDTTEQLSLHFTLHKNGQILYTIQILNCIKMYTFIILKYFK